MTVRLDLVVIGASLGGPAAVVAFLRELGPAAPPVALAQHLHRRSPARFPVVDEELGGLVGRCAEPGDPLRAGVVLSAPPDYHLLVEHDARTSLSTDPPVRHSRPSIDVLFESAAAAYGARVAGVLLSGANQDGADGLRAIQVSGGIVLVQDPESAEAPQMPRAGLDRTTPHHVDTPAGLGRWLRSFIEGGEKGRAE